MKVIIDAVMSVMDQAKLIQVEVSARHIHLCQEDVEALFGKGKTLTPKRELSQPGQYLCEERITLVGTKGKKENIAVLGPERKDTQIELSISDCRELGIVAPIRESGNVENSGGITIEGPNGKVTIKSGVIVAHNHIHLTPESAEKFGLKDKERVNVKLITQRPVTFNDVIVRVNPNFRTRMHIDFDEANGAGVCGFTLGKIE